MKASQQSLLFYIILLNIMPICASNTPDTSCAKKSALSFNIKAAKDNKTFIFEAKSPINKTSQIDFRPKSKKEIQYEKEDFMARQRTYSLNSPIINNVNKIAYSAHSPNEKNQKFFLAASH